MPRATNSSAGHAISAIFLASLASAAPLQARAQDKANPPAQARAQPPHASRLALHIQFDAYLDPGKSAVLLSGLEFPAGSSSARVYISAPGLFAPSAPGADVESDAYLGSISPGHAPGDKQSFFLGLHKNQRRALMAARERGGAQILVDFFDRSGRAVAGGGAESARMTQRGSADESESMLAPGLDHR